MAIAKALKLLCYLETVGGDCPQSESDRRLDDYARKRPAGKLAGTEGDRSCSRFSRSSSRDLQKRFRRPPEFEAQSALGVHMPCRVSIAERIMMTTIIGTEAKSAPQMPSAVTTTKMDCRRVEGRLRRFKCCHTTTTPLLCSLVTKMLSPSRVASFS
jgi:hypothetical protein